MTSTPTSPAGGAARRPVVAVDANGADLGPSEVAEGVALAAARGAHVLLFGPLAELAPAAGLPGVELVDAPVSIAKDPDPARAVRRERDASIVQAAVAVASGRADVLVSGGSTGAALAAGLFNVKRARGIHRPALALPLPVPGRPVTLVDVGANVEVRPEHLVQFAHMGAALAQVVLRVDRSRVGLLTNGEEATKGTELTQAAHAALTQHAASTGLAFVGNVEGTDITSGRADVIVCDGFTGNIALKATEGASQAMIGAIRDVAMSSLRAKLGGLLLRPALRAFRDEIDPELVGGAYLLGLRQLGVVPHGRFSRRGFAQAIELAVRGVDGDVVGRTSTALAAAGALRGSGGNPATSGQNGADTASNGPAPSDRAPTVPGS